MTGADEQAMEWISSNTPKDALFAVNTYLWMDKFPHGTDGGYWIPYFTNRQTTTSTMLFSLGPSEYALNIQRVSFIVDALDKDPSRIDELCADGVDYIYIGPMGDFSGEGLSPEMISQVKNSDLVYMNAGVYIYKICSQNNPK